MNFPKPSLFLYAGLFLALLAVDYLFGVLPWHRVAAQGTEAPTVQARLAELGQVIDATNSPVVTETRPLGYADKLKVTPGVVIVHNPTLGEKMRLTGPAVALEHLRTTKFGDQFAPKFDRFVRLSDPVEVRLNLHRWGLDYLSLRSATEKGTDPRLEARLRTEGTLRARLLDLSGLTLHEPLTVEAGTVAVRADQALDLLRGRVDRLEITYPADTVPEVSIGQLAVGQVVRFDEKD